MNFPDITQKHRNEIRPIFEMLKYKKSKIAWADWETLVYRTEQRIKDSPYQFLSDPPEKEILDRAINMMFTEFLNEAGEPKT